LMRARPAIAFSSLREKPFKLFKTSFEVTLIQSSDRCVAQCGDGVCFRRFDLTCVYLTEDEAAEVGDYA
jgi:hypothetical protein